MNYSNIMKEYPPLSSEDEKELIAECGSDVEKRNNLLVLHNIALSYHFIRKWHIRPNDIDDFISIFVNGMMEVSKNFDPNKGRFPNYVMSFINKYIGYGRGRYLSEDRVMKNSFYADSPIKNSTSKDEGDENVAMMDFLQKYIDPDNLVTKPTDAYVENDDKTEFCKRLCHDILSSSKMGETPYRRKLFKEYFMKMKMDSTGKTKTYGELGKEFGITREAVRQNLEKSLSVARRILQKRYKVTSRRQLGY